MCHGASRSRPGSRGGVGGESSRTGGRRDVAPASSTTAANVPAAPPTWTGPTRAPGRRGRRGRPAARARLQPEGDRYASGQRAPPSGRTMPTASRPRRRSPRVEVLERPGGPHASGAEDQAVSITSLAGASPRCSHRARLGLESASRSPAAPPGRMTGLPPASAPRRRRDRSPPRPARAPPRRRPLGAARAPPARASQAASTADHRSSRVARRTAGAARSSPGQKMAHAAISWSPSEGAGRPSRRPPGGGRRTVAVVVRRRDQGGATFPGSDVEASGSVVRPPCRAGQADAGEEPVEEATGERRRPRRTPAPPASAGPGRPW